MFQTKPAAGEKILRIWDSNSVILLRKSIKLDLQIPKFSKKLILLTKNSIWKDPQNQWGVRGVRGGSTPYFGETVFFK